ncbi:MAG: hypothetical protein KJ634_09795 [Gammaproteobacteria bacterium]|nr:hypothetical protein [Gammaproteobacteria bacterium]MBU1415902.1 hypothetical protein [Gammaproteobacteria bacterium]
MSETTDNASDGRMSFDEAVHYVQQQPDRAAFAAAPVFGERTDDEQQHAEGARVFIVEADGAGSWRVRFVAGPFFSNVYGANEIMAPAEVPDRVRELRFLPSRFDEDWLDGQVQLLIQKLMQANGDLPPEMPDYASAPTVGAGPEAVFPISFIGRDPERK